MFAITRGTIPCGQKVILYGPEGIGKTTLAAQFPGAVFIDTEGSTRNFDVARFPSPTSWEMLRSEAQYALDHSAEVGTLIIDTADWAEKLCNRAVCERAHKSGIEEFGYGKGYVYAAEEFGRLLDLLDRLTASGVHVIFTAHAQLRKVELPDEMGAYDKWELKCSKQLSPMLKEWADLVLFCNYKTIVVQSESGRGKAQGGQRVMYAAHRPTFDAKNRFGLPDELPMDFGQIAHLFNPTMGHPVQAVTAPVSAPIHGGVPTTTAGQMTPMTVHDPAVSAAQEAPANPTPAATSGAPAAPDTATAPSAPAVSSAELEGIYPPLADLLRSNDVTPAEIQIVVGDKGYFPTDMPVRDYPLDFVKGCLVGAWDSVYQCVLEDRNNLPF